MVKDDFGFQLPKLEEIIEPNPLTVSSDTLVMEALARMNRARKSSSSSAIAETLWFSRSSYLLVFEQSRLAGILTERDLVKLSAQAIELKAVTVGEVMTREVITLKRHDFQDIYQIMSLLRQHQIRHLPVVDEVGQLAGIITVEGICLALLYGVIGTLKQELNQQTQTLRQEIAQRQQSELRLRENQQLLELFVRHAPSAMAMLDRELRYLVVSARWREDYQLAEKELIGANHYDIFPEISQLGRQDYQDCLRGKVEFLKGEEDNFRQLDGQVDCLRWELRPWSDLEGNIGGLLLFSEVITERKLLENKLRSSEIQMRRLFEAMTDLILTIELTENSIQILPTQFGVNLDERDLISQIIAQIHAQFLNGAEAEPYQRLISCVLQTQQTRDFEYPVHLEEAVIWFHVHLSYLAPTQIIWVGRNVTHLKEMEQNLFAEKELAQVTLKSIGDAVITTDASGGVQFVNPIAEQLTGWQTGAIKGKPLAVILPLIDQSTREPVSNPVEIVLTENRLSELAQDSLLIARNGTEYAIEASAAPIHDHQGHLRGAVMVFRNVTQSRQLAQELSWQATHDPLTGLYNRRKFEEQLALVIAESQHHQSNHTLCYLDLDRFKIVNDNCGHGAGDRLLQQVTKLFKKRIRASDVFARLGGDEFGLLLHQCPLEIAPKIAEQLRQLIQDFRFAWEDKVLRIGVSIGLVAIDATTANLSELLKAADTACYAAKQKGRNCIHVYHEEDRLVAQQRGEIQWIEKLNRALEENRFCLYAQKIISLEENSPRSFDSSSLAGEPSAKLNSTVGTIKPLTGANRCHYEILLRLIDESGKLIAPGVFLPAAERYDLMPAIDRWVITTFLAGYEVYCQSRKEQKLELPTKLYTINLSGASINHQEFGNFLQQQFERYAIPTKTICFEITETVAIANLDNAVTLIEQLRKLGCSIALDDFGSGMSSFAYLKNLPVDYLKIDGSFVKNIAKDSVDYATVECFNHISQIMNIQTIAEFVEDNAILQRLKQIGVNYAQGYGIERPHPLVFA